MQTSVINIKTNPDTKKQAQKLAEDLGLSLSAVLNGFLKQFVRTKAVSFSLNEEPSEYLIKSLKESREDIKKGRTVSFKSGKEALVYLDDLIEKDKKSRAN